MVVRLHCTILRTHFVCVCVRESLFFLFIDIISTCIFIFTTFVFNIIIFFKPIQVQRRVSKTISPSKAPHNHPAAAKPSILMEASTSWRRNRKVESSFFLSVFTLSTLSCSFFYFCAQFALDTHTRINTRLRLLPVIFIAASSLS